MRAARKDLAELARVREKRKNTCKEMLSTEETYVRTLDVLVNKIRVSMGAQSFRVAVPILSDADLKVLFPASLNMLLSAHQAWLAQLRERELQWGPATCVGDLFLQLSPYLKMYIVYVSNFELSTLKIRELKKKPGSTFAANVQTVFANLGDPSNDLASMLVTPVQRIPRYVMMLKDLLKLTSPQHPDYNNLLKAVKIMTDTTVLVDRKAEDAKNAQKVLEVADSIVDSPLSIVQPNRKVGCLLVGQRWLALAFFFEFGGPNARSPFLLLVCSGSRMDPLASSWRPVMCGHALSSCSQTFWCSLRPLRRRNRSRRATSLQ
jgi:hypothetical protein